MLHTTTPTGMRTLAGAYREADVRRAQAHRADRAPRVAGASAPTRGTVHLASASRIARLFTLLPHAR
ncbi:MAG: hypothetical protein MUQ32_05955 [Chloroflexi bacterium]|nr:hypothetical protein [Chloroflexota bacterium]